LEEEAIWRDPALAEQSSLEEQALSVLVLSYQPSLERVFEE
jgi:hypothetical protein